MSCDCNEGGCSKISCLSLRRLFSAVTVAVVFAITLNLFSNTHQSPIAIEGSQADLSSEGCITMDSVQRATTNGKCWVVFDGIVYDVTEGEKWGLEGHLGQHFCGGVYTKETIEKGPHTVNVLNKFRLAPLCTKVDKGKAQQEGSGDRQLVNQGTTKEESTESKVSTWFRKPLGLKGWRVLFAYLSGIFLILNFSTCYAMPWARMRVPWGGKRIGKDGKEAVRFPLTHWHSWFAWGAVFTFTVHGLLGFLCSWGLVCL